MLESNTITQPDAVEKYFCKEWDKLTLVPLDTQKSILISSFRVLKDNALAGINEELKQSREFYVLKQRFSVFGLEVDPRVVAFLATILLDTKGQVSMYVAYLAYKAKQKGTKTLDFDLFLEIFKEGFPSSEDLLMLWLKQKVKRENKMQSDNLLDFDAASQSLIQH